MWKIWKFSIQNIWDNIFFKNFIVKTAKIGLVSQWYQRDMKKLKGRKIKIYKKLHMKSIKNDIFIIAIDELLILKVGIFLLFALKDKQFLLMPFSAKNWKMPTLKINNASILIINMSFFVLYICNFL